MNDRAASRKKIAIYYPCFLGGGAEAVALWMLESLKDDYDVTLVTLADADWEKFNTMYGTSLASDTVKVSYLLPKFLTGSLHFLTSNSKNFRLLDIHLTLRYFKRNFQDADLVISAYNAADLGKPGIQYIHWIQVIEGSDLAKKLYNKISDFSLDRVRENISIANSRTVADAARGTYNIESRVIYPPVVIQNNDRPWEDKEEAFICSGRLVSAKQPHRVINCLKKVRDRGFNIKLYITGGGGGTSERKYKSFLLKLIRDNSEWITLGENLSYEKYSDILYRCKYGIHFKPEPFGISVAEMVKAGTIPFVRAQGGQLEIIGNIEELCFINEEQAIEKIIHLLKDRQEQKRVLEILNKQKILFSTENFKSSFQEVVRDYFQGNLER